MFNFHLAIRWTRNCWYAGNHHLPLLAAILLPLLVHQADADCVLLAAHQFRQLNPGL